MRKFLFLLSIVFLLSCEKEPTFCWECITTKEWLNNIRIDKPIYFCSTTENEIKVIERIGTFRYYEEIYKDSLYCTTKCSKYLLTK